MKQALLAVTVPPSGGIFIWDWLLTKPIRNAYFSSKKSIFNTIEPMNYHSDSLNI